MTWWKDPVQASEAVRKHGSISAAARALGGVSPRAAREAWAKLRDAGSVDSSASDQTASVAVDTTVIEVDPEHVRWTDSDLLKFHGLDPENQIISRRTAKRWNAALGEGRVAEMNALTITVEARYPVGMLLPARADGWKPPVCKPPKKSLGVPRVLLISTDWHAPYENVGLFDCYLQVSEEIEPDEDWDLGDLVDYPQPSRHRMTRGFEATPQECVNARYRHDAMRVNAAPNARHVRLYGNHDVRVDIAVTEKVGAHVARLARAGEEIPVLDLGNLLRYDELGIEVLRPDGEYHSVIAKLADGLNARHGTKSGPMGGAVKTKGRRSASQLGGHDHKQVSAQHVQYDDDDQVHLSVSASIGCGCRRELGGSYTEDSDIHLGFVVVTDHGNGSHNVEFARYDDRREELYFRGKLYRPRATAMKPAAS